MNASFLIGLKTSIAGRYATSLFDVAKKDGVLMDIYKALVLCTALNKEYPGFWSRHLTCVSQSAVFLLFDALARDRAWPSIFVNFLKAMYTQKRFPLIQAIADVYNILYQHEKQCFDVVVTSSVPLNDTEKDRLAAYVNKHFGVKCHIMYADDTQLLGGFVVQIHNICLDASLKNQLKRLEYTLKGAA